MYPTRLNLLPPKKRAYLQHLVFAQFGKNLVELTLIILSLLGIILVGGYDILQRYFNTLAANLTTISNQQATKNLLIKNINISLIETEKLQGKYILWSTILQQIVSGVPNGITLSTMTLSARTKTFVFVGVARTRQDLLEFQSGLQKLPMIEAVEVPLSQLTEKISVPFSITVTTK